MKSSDWRAWVAALLIALCGFVISQLRPILAFDFHEIRARDDTVILPPVEQTYVASLGYRAALADLIFGHLLVSYGLHFKEKRLFETVGIYLDTINRLDPTFRDPYRYADTLLTMQPKSPPVEHYRKARAIMERGLERFPHDQELWSTAGQFMAYVAAPVMTDPAEQQEYKQAGAKYLMRACELISDNANIPHHCITAATLLSRSGEREAARRFLQRLLDVVDDPEIRELATAKLRRLDEASVVDAGRERQLRFERAWRDDLPFTSRDATNALGPRFDPAACAGLEKASLCATSWLEWGASAPLAEAP